MSKKKTKRTIKCGRIRVLHVSVWIHWVSKKPTFRHRNTFKWGSFSLFSKTRLPASYKLISTSFFWLMMFCSSLNGKYLLLVFSAPAINKIYKITRFQFWVGLVNKNTRIYPDSGSSYAGNNPTSIGLILMKTCVTKAESKGWLVRVWRGSGSRATTWGGCGSFYRWS
jgi:hypothetical protein